MAEEPQSIVLEQLRAIRSEVGSIKDDTREIRLRLATVESGVAGLRRDSGDFATSIASQHLSFDRLTARIDRIEKRLGLANGE